MLSKDLIAHLDIRNYYATCEQNLDSRYKSRAIAIYNMSASGWGRIIAVSAQAKARGISRKTRFTEARGIEELILIEARRDLYENISEKIFSKCKTYVQGLGFEASRPHIDDIVITRIPDLQTAIRLSREIEKGYNARGYQIYIGISFNEDYAHMATMLAKKFGLVYLGKGLAKKLVKDWPADEFPGIGKKRLSELEKRGIHTIGDLACVRLDNLAVIIGQKNARKILTSVRGEDIIDGGLF